MLGSILLETTTFDFEFGLRCGSTKAFGNTKSSPTIHSLAFQTILWGGVGSSFSFPHTLSVTRLSKPHQAPQRVQRMLAQPYSAPPPWAGNGVHSENTPRRPPNASTEETVNFPNSVSGAKDRLLTALSEKINDDNEPAEIQQLILKLESFKMTPVTTEFAEMGLAGRWDLIYSTTQTGAKGNICIRKIAQEFDPDNKLLTNHAFWSFPSKSGSCEISASLVVLSGYEFVAPGTIQITAQDHKVDIMPGKDTPPDEMPDDLKTIISNMQLSLPVEFFDPSGCVEMSFLEPEFRLARYVGERAAGVRNVFTRRIIN